MELLVIGDQLPSGAEGGSIEVPASLRDRTWKHVITTSSDDLIEDFFVPALKVEYLDLTLKISRIAGFAPGTPKDSEENENLMRLLIKRARLIANASTKLPALKKLLSEQSEPLKQALIYCGDGTIDKPEATTMRQVSEACRILREELGIRTPQYTAQEAPEDRALILEDSRQGYLDAVVAIRCLDEGIDIPSAKVGFLLASSSNPRQYVQRRGRLLRKAPGKEFSVIYDFIVVPPDLGGSHSDAVFNVERVA